MGARVSDLLEHWLSHETINRRQFDAGRRFQRVYDAAELGGHATLDLHRSAGAGFARPPPPDSAVRARDELERIRSRLGGFDTALLTRCLGRGEPIGPEPTNSGERADRLYWSRRIRDALMQLSARVALEA